MSVFQETIWALWISHGRHLQTSIKHVDTLSGVLLTRLKNWSKLIELQGPESHYNLLLCCSALTEAAEINPVKTLAWKIHLHPALGFAPWQEPCTQNGWCAGCTSLSDYCWSSKLVLPSSPRHLQVSPKCGRECLQGPALPWGMTLAATRSELARPRPNVGMPSGASCTLPAAVHPPSHLLQQQLSGETA